MRSRALKITLAAFVGLGAFLCLQVLSYAAPGAVVWEAVYSSRPGIDIDYAQGLALDPLGNLAVTGYATGPEGNYDYLTIKYGAYGATDWVQRYDHSWYDVGKAAAFDASGDVTVAGTSFNLDNPRNTYQGAYYKDYRVVRYNREGKILFETSASGNKKDNVVSGVVVDSEGAAYVTGYARNTQDTYPAYYTVKFGPVGVFNWDRFEDWGVEAYATGIRLDSDENVVITGYVFDQLSQNYDIRTLKLSNDGFKVLYDWLYTSPNEDVKAWGLAVSPDGGVVVTGQSSASGGVTLTLKYSPGGKLLWAERYTKSEYKNHGNAVAVDRHGRIYVAGKIEKPDGTADYMLLVYDGNGALIDDKDYAFGGYSTAEDVAVDVYGNIVITGATKPADQPAVFRTIRIEGYPVKKAESKRRSNANQQEEAFGAFEQRPLLGVHRDGAVHSARRGDNRRAVHGD